MLVIIKYALFTKRHSLTLHFRFIHSCGFFLSFVSMFHMVNKWNETKFLLFVVNCPSLYDLPHKYADWNPLYNGGNMCIYIIWLIFSPTRMGLFWIHLVEYIIWDLVPLVETTWCIILFNIQSYFLQLEIYVF